MQESSIEWTDATWNPLRGCSEISPGCANCYAAKLAWRFAGPGQPYHGLVKKLRNGKILWTGVIRTAPEKLLEPLAWAKPREVFVNSMSDLFHEDVSNEFIAAVFCVMAMTPRHTYQILTKRAERLPRWFEWLHKEYDGPCEQNAVLQTSLGDLAGHLKWSEFWEEAFEDMLDSDWPLSNVRLGVSVENQETADRRIAELLKAEAAVYWISGEPLLGPIDLTQLGHGDQRGLNALTGEFQYYHEETGEPTSEWGPALGQVVVGGESGGPRSRPMLPGWARGLRDQCIEASVPFFFKQWGDWVPFEDSSDLSNIGNDRTPVCLVKPDGRVIRPYCHDDGPGQQMARVGKKAAGRLLDGRIWDERPHAPSVGIVEGRV
jgi:protein gp37